MTGGLMTECRVETKDKDMILHFSGELLIDYADQLKSILMDSLKKAKHIEVDVSSVTEADVSCLQLLCSAHRTSKRENKVFGLGDNASDSFKKSVRQAGYARPNGCVLDTSKQCMWKEERFRE
jgi:ABC-type transporter Mla MlaB component